MRRVVIGFASNGFCGLVALLMSGLRSPAIAAGSDASEQPFFFANVFPPGQSDLQAPSVGGHPTLLFTAPKIASRGKIPSEYDVSMPVEPVRHSLFLAVKKPANNVMLYPSAAAVDFQIVRTDGRFENDLIGVGYGFGGNSMPRRHGQGRVESKPGKGIALTFIAPLPGGPNPFARRK